MLLQILIFILVDTSIWISWISNEILTFLYIQTYHLIKSKISNKIQVAKQAIEEIMRNYDNVMVKIL